MKVSFYLIIFYFVVRRPFFCNERHNEIAPDRSREGKELGRVNGGETVFRQYCMGKKICLIKGRIKDFQQGGRRDNSAGKVLQPSLQT